MNLILFPEKCTKFCFRYGSTPKHLPGGWKFYTFWQYDEKTTQDPGNYDVFNGDNQQLKEFALG